MPGMISADEAARAFLKGLERGRFEIVFPRGFVLVMKTLRLLPNAAYFLFMRKIVWRRGGQALRNR
jgi:hypothetical protein